jgi:hypothetical protein
MNPLCMNYRLPAKGRYSSVAQCVCVGGEKRGSVTLLTVAVCDNNSRNFFFWGRWVIILLEFVPIHPSTLVVVVRIL